MGEFYAWTTTGQVTKLESWTSPDLGSQQQQTPQTSEGSAVRIATKMLDGQKFALRQRDGSEVEIILTDAGLPLRNGQVITTVWAARQGAQHGHCIFLENYSTGQALRLHDNVKLIRPKVRLWQTARFGLLATIPVAIAMLMWLLGPVRLTGFEPETVVIAGICAIAVLFLIGFVASRLIFDFLRSEDEQKLWQVAERALMGARQAIRERRI
jgi:hypothetical protein